MLTFMATKKPVDKPRKMLMRIIKKSFVCAFSEPHMNAKKDKMRNRAMHTIVMILLTSGATFLNGERLANTNKSTPMTTMSTRH